MSFYGIPIRHGELKEIRLKSDATILTGYQIFHNYIRPHMSLDGKTPSEACGITIKGDDKWKTLIQRASL
jgi:putative transposase